MKHRKHSRRDGSRDYVLVYGKQGISRPFALRKMAIFEAEQLSKPGSYGGPVTVVEREGHHTREVGRAREGRFSTSRDRDPRRKSAKFERCVHHVKRSSHGRANPWAVCHASLNRKNGKRDPMLYDNVHSLEAQELVLYADNDHALYQQKDAFLQNAYRKMKKGTYSPTLAVKLWMYYVDRAAQKYAKEMGGGSAWHKMFPKPVREEAARYYAQSEAAKLHKGEYSKYPAL